MIWEPYQNLIIGSGEAGKFLAWNLAKKGQETAVVERSMIGGTCPNIACLPSKNVIYNRRTRLQRRRQFPDVDQMACAGGDPLQLLTNERFSGRIFGSASR
jgi:pyruvate/2-oxoglutarate dehydrogenase complex dihydrolipoamide dehydrogenase (E3) component